MRRRFKRRVRRVRRGVTRRKIVDISSTKCHDNMPGANISSDGASTVVGIPAVMASANLSAVIFAPPLVGLSGLRLRVSMLGNRPRCMRRGTWTR